MSIRVAINGFGRIGRQVFKILHQRYPDELQVTHIGVSNPHVTETRALLLQHDSNYGRFDAQIEVDVRGGGNSIIVDGRETRIVGRNPYGPVPEWGRLGIDLVIEASGHFRGRSHLHLTGGARRVLVTAPDTKAHLTVVVGINHHDYDPEAHRIISNASCTTNGLAPMAKVLHDTLGIREGLMSTIHAYTGSQPILDHVSGNPRRSRSAATNIVPTTTGAAKAVALVLPELEGKLNGLAIRVPTPNVSIVDVVVNVEKSGITTSDVNQALKEAADGPLNGILGYSDLPLVSSDFNGCPLSSIVDAETTYVVDKMVKVLSWYDNETGYSNRMVDLAAMIGTQL
jgi:glyceraldehyde 3-phosphate dehydrogenase